MTSLGINFMDHGHAKSLKLLEKMHGLNGHDLEAVLADYIELLEYQFSREDELMETTNFYGHLPHREEHRRVIEEIRILRAHLFKETRDLHGTVLSKELGDWLVDHNANMNKAIAAHAVSKGFKG